MTLIPGPHELYVGDGAAPVGAPYWLGIGGAWVHLEGVRPGVERSVERPSSELTTVDGRRFVQQAPRAPREWSLSWELEDPAVIAALTLAAEAPGGEVWLHDTSAASANMLEARDCFGAGPVALCSGVPLPLHAVGAVVSGRVRGVVPTFVSCWSDAPAATVLLTITYPGGSAQVVARPGSGVRQSSVSFTPAADGPVSLTVTAAATGLSVTEGQPPPVVMLGERTPCRVAVSDPQQTARMAWAGRVGLADYSVTLREVG